MVLRVAFKAQVSLLVGSLALGACSANDAGNIRYLGTPVTEPVAIMKNTVNVTINSQNGGLLIDTASDSDKVLVSAQPFAIAPGNEDGRKAALALMANAASGPQFSATSGTDGVSIISAGSPSTGWDLTVHLPNPYHGLLAATVANGNVTYLAAPNSTSATFDVGVGDIDVENVGNQLTIRAGVSNVLLVTSGTLSGPDPKGKPVAPSSVSTKVGNITAKIPDAASLTITATSGKNGVVRAQADQDVTLLSPDGRSQRIIIGDGTSGTLQVSTGDGDIVFLRP